VGHHAGLAALLGLTGILLAGCASVETVAATKPLIADQVARKIILDHRSIWKDPDSIRDARIGQPYACTDESVAAPGPYSIATTKLPASCLCIELNAKNSYGGYTGIHRTIAVFPETGDFSTLDGGTKGFQEHCQNLHPFPELNGRR
jgi:hypothetical protein